MVPSGAEVLKLRWTASESEISIWQSGVKGTGPSGPVLSFKLILPESSPAPRVKVVSSSYIGMKESPFGLEPCDELFSWGNRGVFRGYPYIELLAFPLQKGVSEDGARLCISFELEFPDIDGPDAADLSSNDCAGPLPEGLFLNYWDACGARRERILGDNAIEASSLPQATTPLYRVSVAQDGIVRMTREYLDSMGVDLSASPISNFHMVSRGVEIPLMISDADSDNVFDPGDAIMFYGQKVNIRNRSIWNGGDFTETNVYFLYGDSSPGLRMQNEDVAPVNPTYTPASSFISNAMFEQNTYMSWADHMRPNGELWFWAPGLYYYVGGGEKTRSIPLNLPHPVLNSDSLTITVNEGGMNNVLHMLDLSLNSGAYLSRTFSGRTVGALACSFVQNQLAAGGSNTLTLRIPSSQSVSDNQMPDSVSVSYLRTTDVDGDAIMIEDGGGNKKYTVGTASYKFSSAPYLLDLSASDASTGLYLPKRGINAGYSSGIVTFDAADTGTSRKFYLSPSTSLPLLVETVPQRDMTAGCDLLIITHPDFHPSGADATWQSYLTRRSQKYTVMAVDTQEIYDRYSFGLFDPTALKAFLTDAVNTWTKPPSYVLFLGDSSYDYKNYLNDATFKNWAPTMLIEDTTDYVDQGWIASDSWLCDTDGDGYPDVIPGRIPVRSYGELEGVLNKIMAYEDQAVPSPWYKTQLFVADTYDETWEQEFETYSTYLKNSYAASPYQGLSVYYHDARYGTGTNADLCAQDIRGYWDDALIVHFAGHSGWKFWGYQDGILSLTAPRGSDLTAIGSFVNLPFVVNSTCYTAGFAYQGGGNKSLFEAFYTASGKGVIGATGYTTISYLSEQEQFATPLFDSIFGTRKERTTGDAVEYARFKLPSANSRPIRSLVLLGDPVLELPLPTVPAPLNFSGASGNQSAALSWSHPSPAPAKYNIYRSTDGGATFSRLNISDITYPAASYNDTGLTNGQTYVYYAVSVNSSGFESPPSQLATVIPLNTSAPATPTGLKATDPGIGNTLQISWSANAESDLSYYKLYRGTSPGSYSYTQQFPKTTTSTQMSGLTEGTRYYFALTATNTSGKESAYSAEVSAVPTSSPIAVKAPAMISDLMVTKSGNDLLLTWSKPLVDVKGNAVTVASFDIYRLTDAYSSPKPYDYNLETVSLASPNTKITVAASAGVTSYNYTDTGAVNLASTVTYLVVARDAAGNRSPASNNAPASILTLRVTKNSPASPTLINFDPVSTRLDGTPTNLIAGYKLFGFPPPMTSSKDHVAPSSPSLTVNLSPALPTSSCDGGTAVYCDSSTSPPLLYTVIAVDNRGNTSLY